MKMPAKKKVNPFVKGSTSESVMDAMPAKPVKAGTYEDAVLRKKKMAKRRPRNTGRS